MECVIYFEDYQKDVLSALLNKGQVTIPEDVRKVLGVASGDRISFAVEGGTVRIVNSAVYAMQMLQREMAGEAERADLTSDDDVMTLVKELRNEDENTLVREDYDGYDGWNCPFPGRRRSKAKN